MVFLLNGKPVDALALIVHRSNEQAVGRQWVKKLRELFLTSICVRALTPRLDQVIPRQLFEIPIQAAVGKKVIARETLNAMRSDVTAGMYGVSLPLLCVENAAHVFKLGTLRGV